MDHQGYFRLFRERWIAPVAGLVLGAGLAAALAFALPPTYSARATLLMSIASPDGTLSDRSQYSLDRISSYPELAFSDDVLGLTIDDLGLDVSPRELAGHLRAVNPPTTMLLQIDAEADTAELAADIANSVAANLADTVSDLENAARDDRYRTTLDISNPASPPASAAEPQKVVIIGLGLLAGLAAGLIAAIAWERLDTSVRSIAQVRRISGLPVLAQLTPLQAEPSSAQPDDGTHERADEGADDAPADVPAAKGGRASASAASARLERAQRRDLLLRETQLAVKQANGGELPRVLLLAPSGAWDAGRDAGVLRAERHAFARAIAATGRSVLLLDDDGTGTGAEQDRGGLRAVLGGTLALGDAIDRPHGERFDVIVEGEPDDAVTERTVEQAIGSTVAEILADFDTFVVEATSLTQPLSLELVAPYADGTVVLVRYGHTRAAELAHTLSRVRLAGLRPLGVVLTDVPPSRLDDVVASWLPDDFADSPAVARVVPEPDGGSVTSGASASSADDKPSPRVRSPRGATGGGKTPSAAKS